MIFFSHLLILKDHSFLRPIERQTKDGMSVPHPVLKTANEYLQRFQSSLVKFVHEKSNDVEDLVIRLLQNLKVDGITIKQHRGKLLWYVNFLPHNFCDCHSSKQLA